MEPLSILLVDDDVDIGSFMKMKLAREAPYMSFHFVEGGSECLEYIKNRKVDCILSDYQMPVMDGMELLLELKNQGSDIPFIFLTGQGNEELASEAFKNGAYDYFTKDSGFAHFARITNSIVQAVRHRQAEKSKKIAEESSVLFKDLLNRTNDAVFVNDSATGRFLFVNDKACSSLGYDREKLLIMRVIDIEKKFPDQATWDDHVNALRVKGHAILEGEQRRSDGVSFQVEVNVSYMVMGERDYMVAMVRDITERKKTEEALAKGLRLQKAILDNIPYMAWLKDVDGRFIVVNESLANAISLRPEDIIGKTEYDFFDREFADKCGETDLETIKSGKRSLFEESSITNDGNTMVLETIKTPVFNDAGVVIGLTGIARDITERKELERQRADFYAMITHDIKSPLIAILGYVDMLTEMPETQGEGVAPIINSISSSCGKLVGLFEDFIAISRIEAENLKLSLFHHEMRPVLEEVLAGLGKAAQAKDIAMIVHCPEGVARLVLMDQKLIHRAVYNLVQNAVNYTPAGGTITVGVDKMACEGRDFIAVSVADTGLGIPPEEQQKVFGKYYRSSANKDVKGTGLGLFIVKRAAEAHGGRVELESKVGKGSTFKILLPS